eukprot:CAMPEP_0177784710 /NCGR_PEP_ID=MMETSP0491_2-20121128/19878_1 /TAXON_ID=63592 /ORGANISM="Tetraselmis chuii, Strain PLY429" /LENGTH=39 /DNA_ID= /DNA_START= /DNA_END= /DNA_ORIENTATION=
MGASPSSLADPSAAGASAFAAPSVSIGSLSAAFCSSPAP